jgi:hypothetical protein
LGYKNLEIPESDPKNDCTNFASQALADGGGVPFDEIWYPGSVAWVNTPAFYDWLESKYEALGEPVVNQPDWNANKGEFTKGLLENDPALLDYLTVNGDQITKGSMVFYRDPKHFNDWSHVAIVVSFEYDPKTGLSVPLLVEHSGPYETDYESLPRLIYETTNEDIDLAHIIIIP